MAVTAAGNSTTSQVDIASADNPTSPSPNPAAGASPTAEATVDAHAEALSNDGRVLNDQDRFVLEMAAVGTLEGVPGNMENVPDRLTSAGDAPKPKIIDYTNSRFLAAKGVAPADQPAFLKAHGLDGKAHWRSFAADYDDALRHPTSEANSDYLRANGITTPNQRARFFENVGFLDGQDPQLPQQVAARFREKAAEDSFEGDHARGVVDGRTTLGGWNNDVFDIHTARWQPSSFPPEAAPSIDDPKNDMSLESTNRASLAAMGIEGREDQNLFLMEHGLSLCTDPGQFSYDVRMAQNPPPAIEANGRGDEDTNRIFAQQSERYSVSPKRQAELVRWEVSEWEGGTVINDQYTGREYRFHHTLHEEDIMDFEDRVSNESGINFINNAWRTRDGAVFRQADQPPPEQRWIIYIKDPEVLPQPA